MTLISYFDLVVYDKKIYKLSFLSTYFHPSNWRFWKSRYFAANPKIVSFPSHRKQESTGIANKQAEKFRTSRRNHRGKLRLETNLNFCSRQISRHTMDVRQLIRQSLEKEEIMVLNRKREVPFTNIKANAREQRTTKNVSKFKIEIRRRSLTWIWKQSDTCLNFKMQII